MFNYQPISEQEAITERYQLLKEGEYDAVISASVDKVSANSGNPMMDMTVAVYDENGKYHDVRDFLVFTKQMMWKVINFAKSADLMSDYETGTLCSDKVIDVRVRVKVAIEEGREIAIDKLKGKLLGSKYPDKNKIEDYIKKSDSKSGTNDDPFQDDDIAF